MKKDKLMELVEDCFTHMKKQQLLIDKLYDELKQKPTTVTKVIERDDTMYRVNSVKLFKQYTSEIEDQQKHIGIQQDVIRELRCEIRCLRKSLRKPPYYV